MALCSAHRFDAALAALPDCLRAALADAGLRRPGVFLRAFAGDDEDAREFAKLLLPRAEPAEIAEASSMLLELRVAATPEAERALRSFAHLEPGVIMEGFLAERQAKARRVVDVEVLRASDATWKPAVRPGRYRLRGDARLAAATGPAARAEAESTEREVWREALVDLLLEAGGPIVEATRDSSQQRKALAAAAGGRRARTLAKRVRSWRRLREWCLRVYLTPYPARPLHLVEYLQARADEPCGLSALQAVAELFVFAEGCRGVPQGSRLVDDPFYAAFQKELGFTHVGPGRPEPKRAPRLPVPFLVALEREVVEAESAPFYRAYAWWQLLAIWGSLRFDDHRGLSPAQAGLLGDSFVGTLSRTKTTGPGKRVLALPIVVSPEAFVVHPNWLSEGWSLWKRLAPFTRDYFLTRPSQNLDGALPVEMTYGESAWLLRGLLAGLPRFGEALVGHAAPLIPLFTQHSGRCWLSSMAALLGVDETRINYLGRWSPSTARTYIRTASEVIKGVQAEVAGRVRRDVAAGDGVLLGEEQASQALGIELEKRGIPTEEISRVLSALAAWSRELLAGQPVGAPRTPPLPDLADAGLETALEDALFEWNDEELPGAGEFVEVDGRELPGASEELMGYDAEPSVEAAAQGLAAAPAPSGDIPSSGSAEQPPPLPLEESEEKGMPDVGFACSISKAGWRRLHRLGGCSRMPGVHYLDFELLGLDRPEIDRYDDFCRQCWRGGDDPQDDSGDGDSDSEEEEDLPVDVMS